MSMISVLILLAIAVALYFLFTYAGVVGLVILVIAGFGIMLLRDLIVSYDFLKTQIR